jgi:UDP-3-O-[3-hydroxymyristoyl] glucosamine N-acyltransferase
MTIEVHPSAVVHPGAQLADGCVIGPYAVIEKDVSLGAGVYVGSHAVLGKDPQLGVASTAKSESPLPRLVIGDGSRIGAQAVICRGARLGRSVIVGDGALIRERAAIGDNAVIGAHVVVENDVSIGDRTKIQTKAYITALTTVESDVFIAPCVITTNDNFMGRTEERFKYKGGPKIMRGARVGAGAVILPNVVIGREAFIAAGSIVTRDAPEGMLSMGAPAKPVRPVNEKERLSKQ